MAPGRIKKGWKLQLQNKATSLETMADLEKFQKTVAEMLEDGKDKTRHATARGLSFDEVVEIFALKVEDNRWKLRGEIYDTPKLLTLNLTQLKKALYDTTSEAYSRIAIDYLIVACMLEHRNLLSMQSRLPANDPTATTSPILEQSARLPANDPTAATSPILEQSELPTDNPHDQTTTTVPILDQATEIAGPPYITPTTPLMAPKSTSQPLPIKVFPEMALSVQVKRGNTEWHISGIADWAMGYGNRAALEDGTVLLVMEAKRRENFGTARAQLLAYLAIIRQLRIQANKKNVTTQGFYSDGESYRFMCIRNNGTVMLSGPYDIWNREDIKLVFNFLLNMVSTAAESSPNTSPTKLGLEQDEKIENFDRDVFVKVFEEDSRDYEEEMSDVVIEEIVKSS